MHDHNNLSIEEMKMKLLIDFHYSFEGTIKIN